MIFNKIIRDIWLLVDCYYVFFIVVYIKGLLNVLVYLESCKICDDMEWMLYRKLFLKIISVYVWLVVDLFVFCVNN